MPNNEAVMTKTMLEVDSSMVMLMMGTMVQGLSSGHIRFPLKKRPPVAAMELMMLIKQMKVAAFSLLAT